jgi:hypothetical protein
MARAGQGIGARKLKSPIAVLPMTREIWRQIKRIFEEASMCEASERRAYLDVACGGDERLRQEVESLLASHDEAGSFIEHAVCRAAADLIDSGHDELVVAGWDGNPFAGYVVGWLVCVSGPDRGRDYPIRPGANSIGRAPTMDIRIAGDNGVSRDRHAIISYSAGGNEFRVEPVASTHCVYLNDDEVTEPSLMNSYDRLQLGQTELIFVPLCHEGFRWQ